MANSYPGIGRLLTQATYDGTNYPVVTYPETPVIEPSQYSNYEAVNDAQSWTLTVETDVAGGGDIYVEWSDDPTFAVYAILDTLTTGSALIAYYSNKDRLQGCIRVRNGETGVDIVEVRVNKVVASVG